MKILKPDFARTISLEGIARPVLRPVDIDQAKTGFSDLRTLRVYRFETGEVVDGHAEEDEVFIVVLTGAADLIMTVDEAKSTSARLSLAPDVRPTACAAYLPPHASYRLVPRPTADVAYVRATPSQIRAPRFFPLEPVQEQASQTLLLEETAHAEKLRLRLVRFNASPNEVSFAPLREADGDCEALIHVTSAAHITAPGSPEVALEPWQTVALSPAERPRLRFPASSSALALIIFA